MATHQKLMIDSFLSAKFHDIPKISHYPSLKDLKTIETIKNRTAAPGSAVFPWLKILKIIFWHVVLHSQRHFDRQLCLWFMPVSLKYPTLAKKNWRNKKKLGKTKKHTKNFGKKNAAIFLNSLKGGGASQDSQKAQPRLSEYVFCFCLLFFSNVFFCFSNVCLVFRWVYRIRRERLSYSASRTPSHQYISYKRCYSTTPFGLPEYCALRTAAVSALRKVIGANTISVLFETTIPHLFALKNIVFSLSNSDTAALHFLTETSPSFEGVFYCYIHKSERVPFSTRT